MLQRLRACRVTSRWVSVPPCRSFITSLYLGSGHNRWSKIKHDKAREDKNKSRERTVLAVGIARASKDGGPDPKMNPGLAHAINVAKKGQLSKEAIERAIAKGQGRSLSGAPLENVLIEAILPHNVSSVIECQTESKNRILQDTRLIISRAGGCVTPTTFMFDKKGKIWFSPKQDVGVDEVMDDAIEAGAEDITFQDGKLVVETSPEAVTAVSQKLCSVFDLQVEQTRILYDPRAETLVKLDADQASQVQSVLDSLEDLDDVQDIYINAEN